MEDVQSYYEDCMYDLCSCASNLKDCMCPNIGSYADVCASLGVSIDWRHSVTECSKFDCWIHFFCLGAAWHCTLHIDTYSIIGTKWMCVLILPLSQAKTLKTLKFTGTRFKFTFFHREIYYCRGEKSPKNAII